MVQKISKLPVQVILFILFLSSCAHKQEKADLVIHNAKIYSLDGIKTQFQAMAIADGKIVEWGPEREIMNKYRADEFYDAQKRVIIPAFHAPVYSKSNAYLLPEFGYVPEYFNSNWEYYSDAVVIDSAKIIFKEKVEVDPVFFEDKVDLRWVNLNHALEQSVSPENLIAVIDSDSLKTLPKESFYIAYNSNQNPFNTLAKLGELGVDKYESLKHLSAYPAMVNFYEYESGTLEKGKSADFIVLNYDYFKANPEQVKNIDVLFTFAKGEKIYSKY